MAGDEDISVVTEIQEKYVPFLKKLISFLEKNKKATPDNLSRLKSIHTVFTTASKVEQIEVFRANKKKLEKWYKNSQKDKANAAAVSTKSTKRSSIVDDTDSSQGASEIVSKKSRLSEPTISSAPSVVLDSDTIAQIKKEKAEQPKAMQTTQQSQLLTTASAAKTLLQSTVSLQIDAENENDEGQISFTCASCQFQTYEEQEFMKHTRTDHRSDLSMWCKQCGKCFSNAGVLVTHIKEKACSREEMIYRCGVKDCAFETNSGQTFVHHLRHCHKGSPFIFCVHCQKIFTLPHCLILHMQDDCPHKEKNRKNPSESSEPLVGDTTHETNSAVPTILSPPAVTVSPMLPTISSVVSTAPKISLPASPRITTPRGRGILPMSRGRGRGRGRGRARPVSDSSDSDADDPSWHPEENTDQTNLRRSGRWAKKLNDVMNVQPKQQSKLSLSELNATEMLKCPCCEFMAAFKSVLQDHYIAHHKVPNKNACLVCHLKFESTTGFLEHFVDHASGKLVKFDLETSNASSNVINLVDQPTKSIERPFTSGNNLSKEVQQTNNVVSWDKELFEGVVQNVFEAKVIDPTSDSTKCVKIPYQAAVKDKHLIELKVQKFEDLKSPSDLSSMKCQEKLQCFYKCVMYGCVFTTHDNDAYLNHIVTMHEGKTMFCCYCIKEYSVMKDLIHHLISEHGKREYQCNSCFYRAYSKIHVLIHIKHYHPKDSSTEVYTCDPIVVPPNIEIKCNVNEISNTIWPLICAIGECSFQTFDPKEFKTHNDTAHRSVSVYFCHYCKVDFLSLKRLLNHYRLHGINTFQCNYCIHGSETKDEILLHLCHAHTDQPLRAFMRSSVEDVLADSKVLPYAMVSEVNQSSRMDEVGLVRSDSPTVENINTNLIDFENQLYEVVGETYYPRYLNQFFSDFTCGVSWCHEKADNMLCYIEHLGNTHSSMNFPCPHCPSISETWYYFKDHLKCHGPDLYACGVVTCNFHNWNKTVVSDHLKKHSKTDIKVVIIRESTQTKDGNEMDCIKSLPQACPFTAVENCYQCFFCRYISINKQVMKNHMYSEMVYKRFSCNYCNKKFVSRKEIKNHCISQHSGDVKCSIDSNAVIETIIKKIISQKIKSPDPKSIPCPACNKNFKSAIQWQRHMCLCVRNHYQPYDCGYCSFRASDHKILKFHSDQMHSAKPVLYTEVSSDVVEEEIGKKLQQLRLAYLNKILYTEKYANESHKLCFTKFYVCSVCLYESNHKHNTQVHIKNTHVGISVEITKKMVQNPNSLSSSNTDTASNDSTNSNNNSSRKVKRYRCGFCIKKLLTLEELEKHVESLHLVRDEPEYFYYYSPDPKASFPVVDRQLYECSYCKCGKENLHSLKKHSDLMHSESPFKVKGYVVRNRDKSSILSCGYCYLRVQGISDLKQHSTSQHPLQLLKSIGGYSYIVTKKSEHEEICDLPYKRVKFGSVVCVCNHCGAAYSRPEEVTAHSRRSHSRLQLDFTKKYLSIGDENYNLEFYKCEFCRFTSEKEYLDIHLKAKHKMRVTCGYCNKRFEFATKLREHHDVAHKNLPRKYSQGTVGSIFIKNEPTHSISSDDFQVSNHAGEVKILASNISRTVPDTIDLSQIYTYTFNDNNSPTRISVLTYSKMYNIFPIVYVEDIKNKK